MNEVIKWELIDALRSGNHVQCRDQLEDEHGAQCCLGVLCDIMGVPRHEVVYPMFPGSKGPPHTIQVHYGYGEDEDAIWCDTELPEAVRVEAGLTSGEMCDLMGLNDDGKDFDFISNYVEEVL